MLVLRLVLGGVFIAHGAQKLIGWFGGPGLKGTAGFFDQTGLKPGSVMALLAGLAEFGGGLLVLLGLLTPVGALAVIVVMIVAILRVHLPNVHGPDLQDGAVRSPFVPKAAHGSTMGP